MKLLIHQQQPVEHWREGVTTRMRVSAQTGSHQLCIFEQFCEPGLGAPTHVHAVEELLEVIAGSAEVWVGSEAATLAVDQSVLIPAGTPHGFRNAGQEVLHVRASLAASIFEASYEDRGQPSRRWTPEPRG